MAWIVVVMVVVSCARSGGCSRGGVGQDTSANRIFAFVVQGGGECVVIAAILRGESRLIVQASHSRCQRLRLGILHVRHTGARDGRLPRRHHHRSRCRRVHVKAAAVSPDTVVLVALLVRSGIFTSTRRSEGIPSISSLILSRNKPSFHSE